MLLSYESRRYAINCDWLQFSVMLGEDSPDIMCPDGFRMVISQGNNIFRNMAVVYDLSGEKYLTLLWSPYSRVINSRLMTVQVANHLLYKGGIHEAYRILEQCVDCSFNSMGRVDVACDFEVSPEQLRAIAHLNSGHYYVQGKSQGSAWWHRDDSDAFLHKQLHCLTWGSPTSEIRVKLYNKSRELGVLDASTPCVNKPYIVAEWRDTGLDVTKVWRVEFSMQGAGQLRWQGKAITIDDVSSSEWLARVFCGMYAKRFVVRLNQGRRNGKHNDDAIVSFLSLPSEKDVLKWADSTREPVAISEGVKLLRTLMRSISSPCVMSCESVYDQYAGLVVDLVQSARLGSYFRRLYGTDAEDYLLSLRESVGSGIVNEIAEPSLSNFFLKNCE